MNNIIAAHIRQAGSKEGLHTQLTVAQTKALTEYLDAKVPGVEVQLTFSEALQAA